MAKGEKLLRSFLLCKSIFFFKLRILKGLRIFKQYKDKMSVYCQLLLITRHYSNVLRLLLTHYKCIVLINKHKEDVVIFNVNRRLELNIQYLLNCSNEQYVLK